MTADSETPDSDAYEAAIAAEVRAALGRTRAQQKDIAEHYNFGQGWLSKRVNGIVPWGIPELVALCDFLGIDVAELLANAKREALKRAS